ncbi:MAG: transposase [Fimbriimonadales bacterium]
MPEHVHLLLHPRKEDYDIGAIRKAIKQSVSQRAIGYLAKNKPDALKKLKVIRKDGTVTYRFWQNGGGYDRNLFSPKALRASIDYIHNNPVRRGLVDSALAWKWSSLGSYSGMSESVLAVEVCESAL